MQSIKIHILSIIGAISGLIAVGTYVFHVLENWTLAESFYFSVCTLTTVGYGDLYPTTDGSRIFAAIFMLVGVGIMFTALTTIGGRYLREQERRINGTFVQHFFHHETHHHKHD